MLKVSGEAALDPSDEIRHDLMVHDMLAIGDALEGVDHCLQSLGQPVGRSSIGVLGCGYGGYLAMQALACSSRFGVGACVGGFVDDGLRRLETGDVRRGKSAPMVQGTILDNLDAITAPLLMLHGASDKVAPPSHSRVVYHHLHARSVPAQLVVYPEEGHRLTSLHARRDAMQRICAWMISHLKPGSALSS